MTDPAFAEGFYPNPMRMPIAENNETAGRRCAGMQGLYLVHEARWLGLLMYQELQDKPLGG